MKDTFCFNCGTEGTGCKGGSYLKGDIDIDFICPKCLMEW